MYVIEVTAEFCASHQLRLADGSLEPLHGHNWHVQAKVESGQLDDLETVMDFHVLENMLKQIINPWMNGHLNNVPPFDRQWNPSAERVAEHIGMELARRMKAPVRVAEVRVTEAAGCSAIFRDTTELRELSRGPLDAN